MLAWSKSTDGKLRPWHIWSPDGWEKSPSHVASFFSEEGEAYLCSEEINHRVRGQRSVIYTALWPVVDSYFSWMEKQEREKLCLFFLTSFLFLNLISLLLHSIPKHCFLCVFIIYSSLSYSFLLLFAPASYLPFPSCVIIALFVSDSSLSFSRNLLLVTTCLLTNSCLLEHMRN